MSESYQTYYEAQAKRNAKDHPIDWVTIPTGSLFRPTYKLAYWPGGKPHAHHEA